MSVLPEFAAKQSLTCAHGYNSPTHGPPLQAAQPYRMESGAAPVLYEVRIYSMEARTFGQVLQAKQIRAAHCLTSVQFSPTSEHLMLAYGR